MQEALAQILVYLWGVWRYRWLALCVAWLVALGGWLWVWQLPEAYVASARIYVDTSSVLRPLLRGLAIEPNINQRLSMMTQTLLSRPNLEKLMRMTDLDLQVNDDAEREDMLTKLNETINLSGDSGNSSLYSISVKDEDRDTARRITQSLISVFIESSLNEKRADSSGAQEFLDEQIAEYEQRLIAAENRLARFKQENVDVLPGSEGDYYSRLQASREALKAARLELSELENRRREVQRQLDGEEPQFMSSGFGTGAMSPLDSRIQNLKVNMDSLLARYTDKHPEVRQIQGLIDELEAERQAEYERMRYAGGGEFAGLNSSPVYQGMRSMLAETDAQVAELRVRVSEYERRAEELDQKVNNIPTIEAELKQLDRDYNVIAAQHNEMLERRESARLSQDVEKNSSDVVFRVIDPPFVPLEPSEPNKALFNGAVLLAAVAVGAGVALLLSLVSPVIGDPRTLVNVTGLPLLGIVTLKPKPEQRRRESYALAAFAICGLGLLITYAGLSFMPAMLTG